MMYLTQLVYLNAGKAAAFEAFEDVALPLMSKYGGQVLLRLRPHANCVLQAGIDVPYEIHVVRFNSGADFEAYTRDPQRQQVMRLKDESVRRSILIAGAADVPPEAIPQ
jgi:hypothetical protein